MWGELPDDAAKVKNPLGSDDLTLAEALEIKEEVPMWKEAIRVELTSLIQKRNVFKIVTMNEIPTEHRSKIYNLMILLKRKRNQFREISKYKCRLVVQVSERFRKIFKVQVSASSTVVQPVKKWG